MPEIVRLDPLLSQQFRHPDCIIHLGESADLNGIPRRDGHTGGRRRRIGWFDDNDFPASARNREYNK